MKLACKQHIDHAIDDFVDIRQVAPEVTFAREWRKANGSPLKASCDYCRKPAIYLLLSREKSES